MNIIIVGRNHGQSRRLVLNNRLLVVTALLFVGVLGGAVYSGFKMASEDAHQTAIQSANNAYWQEQLQLQKNEVARIRQEAAEQVDALTLRMGEMQSRLLRLDALGQRLTQDANLDEGEFDFETNPGQGGPDAQEPAQSYIVQDLVEMLDKLERQIDNRQQQLELLNELLVSRNIQEQSIIDGRPIEKGWLSSHYGYRTDPFTGKRAWHAGVDFAGKEGSNVLSVAAGVVTWSGERWGYGNLVEVSHGDGYSTRYAHCKEVHVKVGDIVQKEQIIAKMGSTGRSTGPHVHYEVIKDGKTLNPARYVYRAKR